jgi:hypothetical protein
MDKKAVVPIPNDVPYNHKWRWSPVICKNMGGIGGLILSTINQAQNDKYCMFSLIFGI